MRRHDHGRAVHPAMRASIMRAYPLADAMIESASVGPSYDVSPWGSFFVDAPAVASPRVPPVVRAWPPFARRFRSAAAPPEGLSEATPASSDIHTAALGDWTVEAIVRLTALSAGVIFACSGLVGDVTADHDTRFSFSVAANGAPVMSWRHSGPTTITRTATDYRLPVGQWVVVAWRKRATTGAPDPGPGGTCTLDLAINGEIVETFTAVPNTSNGTSATRIRIGHEETTGGAVQANPDADIGGAFFYAAPLLDDELRDDARRGMLLPFSTWIDHRVRTTDNAGRIVELTDVSGVDHVSRVAIKRNLDNATQTATVSLLLAEGDASLAGLRTDVLANLDDADDPTSFVRAALAEGNEIEIFAARAPNGVSATPRDFFSVFLGDIDEIEENDAEITIEARDKSGVLIDTFIEQEVDYGDDGTLPSAEGEMQKVLNDNDDNAGNDSVAGLTARNGSYAPLTLFTPVATGTGMAAWRQRREPVMSALQTVAGTFGWRVGYAFDDNTHAWRLTLAAPDRTRVDIDAPITGYDIRSIRNLTRSLFGMRNVVRVVYQSSETTIVSPPAVPAGYIARVGNVLVDGEDQRTAAFVEVESTTSINLYGRRCFMEISEPASSQTSTVDIAFRMAFAALQDLENVPLDQGVDLTALPELDVNDVLRFASLRHRYTARQTLATQSVDYSAGDDGAKTSLTLRGKPALGFAYWLSQEVRPGRARPPALTPVDALTDIGKTDRAGVVVNILDKTSYLTGGKFLAIRNSDFTRYSKGKANPPDGWSMVTGAFGTDVELDETKSLAGNRSIRFDIASAEIISDFVAVDGDYDTPYSVEVTWQWKAGSVPTTTTKRVEVVLQWYDATKTLIAAASPGWFAGEQILRPGLSSYPAYNFPDVPTDPTVPTVFAEDRWHRSRVDGILPPGPAPGDARFVRVLIRPDTNGAHTVMHPQGLLVDSVSVYQSADELRSFHGNPWTYPGGSPADWYNIRMRPPTSTPVFNSFDYGSHGGTFFGGNAVVDRQDGAFETIALGVNYGAFFYARRAGTYVIDLQVVLVVDSAWDGGVLPPSGTSPVPLVRVMRNATYNNVTFATLTGTEIARAQGGPWQLAPRIDAALAALDYATIAVLQTKVSLAAGDRLSVDWYAERDALGNNPIGVFGALTADASRLTYWRVRMQLAE